MPQESALRGASDRLCSRRVLPAEPPLRRAFWAILALGLVCRLLFGLEVVARDIDLETGPPRDMWLYAFEAHAILDGDPLLERFPERLGTQVQGGVSGSIYLATPEGRARFQSGYGQAPLLQAPLYPYLLALSWRACGSFTPVRLLQIGATLLVPWLAFLLARAVGVREAAALAAMALLAFHPTLVLYGAFLLRTILGATTLLLCVLSLARHVREPSIGRAAWLGASLGLVHLSREIVPFLLPWVLLGLLAGAGSWRRGARQALAAVAAFGLVVTPLLVRNALCGSSLLHTGTSQHLLLFFYNFVGADGSHLVRPDFDYVEAHVPRGATLLEVLRAAIATHPDPGSFLLLLGRKLHLLLNGYEAWNNINPYLYQRWLASLRLFPLSSTALLVPAIPGLGLLLRRWRRTWPVLAGGAVVVSFCLAGVVLARYRVMLLPYLAIGAGCALELLVRLARGRRWQRLGACACALLVAGWVAWPRGRTEFTPLEAWAALGIDYQQVGKPRVAWELARSIRAELTGQDSLALQALGGEEIRAAWGARDWTRVAGREAGERAVADRWAREDAALFQSAAEGAPARLAGLDRARAGQALALVSCAAAAARAAGDREAELRWLRRLAEWIPAAPAVRQRLAELERGDR